MKRNPVLLPGLLLAMAMPLAVIAEEEGDAGMATALTSGTATIGVRARYETVDDEAIDDDAQATTARLRFNYRTGHWGGWSAFGEFDHVFNVFLNDYNSGGGTSPGKAGQYPVVADPNGSDLNQLYLDFSSSPDWKWRFGRQRILLDNQRYVGGVGWRQNEQTYDGFSLTTTAARKSTVFYSYIANVRRIFGQSVSAGSNDVDIHLLNAQVKLNDQWSITPYVYYIDNEDVTAFSTSTFGARVTGGIAVGDGKIAFLGEFATQSDAADAPVNFDADYTHLNALWSAEGGLSLGIGFESLGGSTDPGEAFRTPLATLHAFNGWADKFLATPDAGLDDTYFTVKYKAGKWNLTGVYHDFTAETGSSDFGKELDISAGRKLSDHYGLLLKGAFFSADSGVALTDTDKFWIMLTASY